MCVAILLDHLFSDFFKVKCQEERVFNLKITICSHKSNMQTRRMMDILLQNYVEKPFTAKSQNRVSDRMVD